MLLHFDGCSILLLRDHSGICHSPSLLVRQHKWSVTGTTLAAYTTCHFKIAAVTYKTKHSGLPTYLSDNLHDYQPARTLRHLQHSYFNNYDVSPPSHLVPLPSLLLTSGIHSLYKLNPLTVSKLSNVDRKLSYSSPLTLLRTVQRYLSALFQVFYDLLRYGKF